MEKKYLQKLIEQGNSSYSIAKITNKSQSTIMYFFKKYGIKTKRNSHKVCIRCGNKTIGGRKYCSCCRVTLQRFRYKLALINYKGGKCEECSITDMYLLDFHHIDPKEKEFSISKGIKSWDKSKKEVEKCKLLCANCHRKYHKKDYWNGLRKDALNYNGQNKELKELLNKLP